MKIFVDSANVADISEALRRGFVSGVTTNPSLLAKEPKGKFEDRIGEIVELLKGHGKRLPLSVEVFFRDPKEILRQALEFQRVFDYDALSIKVQVGWDELAVVHELSENGISVNCTACMSVTQALMAAEAGATYVSLFWGRIRDGGIGEKFASARDEAMRRGVFDKDDFDPKIVTSRVRVMLNKRDFSAEIIVGSIRSVVDIRDAMLAGAHIVTVPPKFFKDMASHFKTKEVVDQFLEDFNIWLQ